MSRSMSVPPFFPLIRPGCEAVAAAYFQCVERGVKEDLGVCAKDEDVYVKCIVKSLKTGPKTAILTEYQK